MPQPAKARESHAGVVEGGGGQQRDRAAFREADDGDVMRRHAGGQQGVHLAHDLGGINGRVGVPGPLFAHHDEAARGQQVHYSLGFSRKCCSVDLDLGYRKPGATRLVLSSLLGAGRLPGVG